MSVLFLPRLGSAPRFPSAQARSRVYIQPRSCQRGNQDVRSALGKDLVSRTFLTSCIIVFTAFQKYIQYNLGQFRNVLGKKKLSFIML